MKKKIVIWANDENDKKILVGLELKAQENKIAIHTFPEEIATELFYNEMMENWRNDKEVAFPEGHTTIEKELNVAESILPDNIKVTRSDIVNRAATEWQFIVLSTKLYEMYKSELEEKKEKVKEMTHFDNGLWSEMKEFWNKVQSQVFDNNLLRDHANQLKEGTNTIFEQLKKLRLALDKEFDEISKRNKGVFNEKLVAIDEKINKGLGLKPIFEELKNIQNEYKDTKFNRKDRAEIWDRIDKAFKKVKGKKPGGNKGGGGNNSPLLRVQRRYDGLMSALGKMQHSISRDQKDIDYEKRKINTTDGQLEQQIRQAKLKMIEERINSKKAKLDDMLKTKAELEGKLDKEKKKEEVNKAKQSAKEKIATKMEAQTAALSAEDQSKLKKAAEDIAGQKKGKKDAPKKEASKAEAPKAEAPKAEAPNAEAPNAEAPKAEAPNAEAPNAEASKAEELQAEAPNAEAPKAEEPQVEAPKIETPPAEKLVEEAKEESAETEESMGAGILGAVGGLIATAKDMAQDAMDSVAAVTEVASDKITEAMTGEEVNKTEDQDIVPSATEKRGEKVNELLGSADSKEEAKTEEEGIGGGLLGAAAGLLGGAMATAKNLAGEAKEKIEDLGDMVEDKVDEVMDGDKKPEDAVEAAAKESEETKEGIGGGILGAAAGLLGGAIATATTLAGEAKDKLEDLGDAIEDKVDSVVDSAKDKVEDVTGEEE